jgi:alkylation response protein AidB-like acyl-CoA dehydrogenase
MDFSFTPEQEMLRDSLGKLLAQSYAFDQRQALLKTDTPRSEPVWQALTEIGLLALPFTEAEGGLGGQPSDLVACGMVMGRHIFAEPWLGAIILGGRALALGGDRAQPLLADVMAGSAQVALAHEERHGIGAVAQMATTLTLDGDALRLSGEKKLVLGGADATTLIVSARARDKLTLVRVDPAAPGVTVSGYRMIDGRRAATVRFDAVALAPDAALRDDAEAALNAVIDDALLTLSAEAVGAMSALLEMTGAYAATRKQFGVPIGSFQAMAHRLADMKIAWAKAQALLLYTTALIEAGKATPRDVALLKAQMGRLGRSVGESAVQVHGGIGMTDELAVGHYLKRLLCIEAMLGSTDYHLRRVGAR